MAEKDTLTGLYTREAFCRIAGQQVRSHPETRFDIVLSDFINFKHFNERFGTEIGDLLLIRTAEMLTASAPNVIVGRYGADRFVSLVPHLEPWAVSGLEHFQLPDEASKEFSVSSIMVKFGICTDVTVDSPISVFCDRALTALEAIKHEYGKKVSVYSDYLGEITHRALLIEETMNSALVQEQFEIYYQPKMDLASERICGAEALVRWNHPVLGFLTPYAFIPLFERNGFIAMLDKYVLAHVCRDLAQQRAAGIPNVPVSVNISQKSLSLPDAAKDFQAIVREYGIENRLLHLEVTESACADAPDILRSHINELHDAGFGIELDDFGKGYSSLSTLSDFPIDVLKLDMSLLQKDTPGSARNILEVAVKLAKTLNFTTIQEGVETAEQLERMKALGCDLIQGYFYAKPLPKVQYEAFLKANS